MSTRFTNRQDAIEDIITALGDYGDDFDIDAIFDACYEWRVDTDADGNERLNTAGFQCVVDDDAFWEAVRAADRTV